MRAAQTFSPAALRLARLRKGLTQLEVAERCARHGVPASQSLMSHWETGRTAPSPGYLPALAKSLGCKVDDFFAEPASHGDAEDQPTSGKAVA
jgi:transcriptional regulator with XRE-family HTH domain